MSVGNPRSESPAPDWSVGPARRPLRTAQPSEIQARLAAALAAGDGLAGAHCIHELWMRGEMAANITAALARLWKHAAATVPEWLPMTSIEWLPLAYEVAARFSAARRGRCNIYLVLLDYSDSRDDPHGVYVGMSQHAAAVRFDQHKAGIRAAGSVLKRGVEVLTGPVLHLQRMSRAEALVIEERLAEALRAEGLLVHGGH